MSQPIDSICNTLGLTLLRPAGKGAFKDTYEVQDAQGTHYALKVFRATVRSERETREFDAMLRCKHPNIGRLVDVRTVDLGGGQVMIAIEEFLPGGSLAELCAKSPISEAFAKHIALKMSEALTVLRSEELVHRDIKPENIMFRSPQDPVLVDFGLVRDLQATSLTATWANLGPGTPFYAAPEQLLNEKALVESRTDQFSLGVALSMAVYGHHTYARKGDDSARTVERVIAREGPAASSARLGPILNKMTAAWPIDRFLSPEHLHQAWSEL